LRRTSYTLSRTGADARYRYSFHSPRRRIWRAKIKRRISYISRKAASMRKYFPGVRCDLVHVPPWQPAGATHSLSSVVGFFRLVCYGVYRGAGRRASLVSQFVRDVTFADQFPAITSISHRRDQIGIGLRCVPFGRGIRGGVVSRLQILRSRNERTPCRRLRCSWR
jgi:hypothetical protein